MGTWRGWTGALALSVALAVPQIAAAQEVRLDDAPVTPRMMGLGGRAEALSSSTSSMFANPAMMGASQSYHGDAYALYDATVNRFSFGSAIMDSTRAVAAGLTYVYSQLDNMSESRRVHDTRLVLAVPFGTVFGIGVSGRYLDANGGPMLGNMTALQARAWTGFTFDAGLFVRPIPQLTVSVSGYNLNNPQSTVAPIAMGAGVAVSPLSWMNIVADAYMDFATMGAMRGRYSGGVELFLGSHVPVRVGYAYDDLRGGAQAVTGGLGYLAENWGLELGLRQGFLPVPQTTVMLSLRFFYRPGGS